MNRIGRMATILVCALIWRLPDAFGQTADVAGFKKAHNDCAYESVVAQLSQIAPGERRRADMSLLAERAFQACATEEQALALALTISKVSSEMAQVVLIRNRLDIKRELQGLAAGAVRQKK
jgi:hypothetical protein